MDRSRPKRKPPPVTSGKRAREGFVAVGLVLTAHGLRGELKVRPLTDFPERFQPESRLWLAGVERRVLAERPMRENLLISLEGIDTREDAAALRGEVIEIAEDEIAELEPDEYYQFDIIGMEVYTVGGELLGVVEEIIPTGSNDVYIVRREGVETLVPAIGDVVREVDVPGRRMVVAPMEGM